MFLLCLLLLQPCQVWLSPFFSIAFLLLFPSAISYLYIQCMMFFLKKKHQSDVADFVSSDIYLTHPGNANESLNKQSNIWVGGFVLFFFLFVTGVFHLLFTCECTMNLGQFLCILTQINMKTHHGVICLVSEKLKEKSVMSYINAKTIQLNFTVTFMKIMSLFLI